MALCELYQSTGTEDMLRSICSSNSDELELEIATTHDSVAQTVTCSLFLTCFLGMLRLPYLHSYEEGLPTMTDCRDSRSYFFL